MDGGEQETEMRSSASVKECGGQDTRVLCHHLWGFLNENLEGDAWSLLANAERQNGAEVWRRVLRDVT